MKSSNSNCVRTMMRMKSGEHTIDHVAANKFIHSQLTPIRQQAAKDLIENTEYLTQKEIYDSIENLVIKLYETGGLESSESIYMYTGPESKSFYFMSTVALYYIRKHGYKEPTHYVKRITMDLFTKVGDSPFIIIDDVSYSGYQLSTMLHDIYYDTVIKQKMSAPNIYVACVAVNDFSRKKLETVPTKKISKWYVEFNTSPFHLLYETLYTPLLLKIGIERYFYLNVFFSLYTESYPYVSLYLDHKIADDASTYRTALMYGPVVPTNYDYVRFFEYLDYKYEIIPSGFDASRLYTEFNEANGTDFSEASYQHEIVKFLVEKLKRLDVYKGDPVEKLAFYPFINKCKESPDLLENINDDEIINCPYDVFLLPEEDTVGLVGLDYYIEEFGLNKSAVMKKIKRINCPLNWYKMRNCGDAWFTKTRTKRITKKHRSRPHRSKSHRIKSHRSKSHRSKSHRSV